MDLPPCIDLSAADDPQACAQLYQGLRSFGAVLVRDPRVSTDANDLYRAMMCDYFAQSDSALRQDMRPEFHHQVGVSPPGKEQARDHRHLISTWPKESWPHIAPPDFGDPKWRFFHQLMGPNQEPTFPRVIPAAFETIWMSRMEGWGQPLLQATVTVMAMLERHYGLPSGAWTKGMNGAPHLLAPSGMELRGLSLGDIINAFHYDLNLITIHGPANFPGLRIWRRDGKVMLVRVPPGCLLVQVGKQLEWVTAGDLLAGFHEVVVLPETVTARELALEQGRPSIRVSSTVFAHFASKARLEIPERFLPEDPWQRTQVLALYPPITAWEQVLGELKAIGLSV